MTKQLEFNFVEDIKKEERKKRLSDIGRKVLIGYELSGVGIIYGIFADCIFNHGHICEAIQNYMFK